MSTALPLIVLALPLVAAVVLAWVASWRIGAWINAGCASLQFVVACALVWCAGTAEAYLVLLTSLVAMTVSWFGRQDLAASLVARSLTRQRARVYHSGYQVLIGCIQGATLANDNALTWLSLAGAVAAAAVVTGAASSPAAASAATRLLRVCGSGLILALLGTLLSAMSPGLAGAFLLLGYAALAGLVPLHSWMVNAALDGIEPGATIVTTLLPNVPLLLFMRLDIAPWLLMASGLASLLVGAIALLARPADWKRGVVLAGMAQLGMVVFAISVGARTVAWLLLLLLALARSAVLQSRGNDMIAWLTLALLPLLALYLIVGSTAQASPWLLVPLATGALVVIWAMLERCPAGIAGRRVAAIPVWLQIALAVLLAFAIPGPVGAWSRMTTG